MTPERWEEIKKALQKGFPLEEQGREDILVETAEGAVKQGEAEYVIFNSPLGRTKLQFQKKPRVEGKKFFYSHRQGDAARVEYKFSADQFVYTLKAYKWDDTDELWKEIDSNAFQGF